METKDSMQRLQGLANNNLYPELTIQFFRVDSNSFKIHSKVFLYI